MRFYAPKKGAQEKIADSAQEREQEILMKLLEKSEMAVLVKTLAKGL